MKGVVNDFLAARPVLRPACLGIPGSAHSWQTKRSSLHITEVQGTEGNWASENGKVAGYQVFVHRHGAAVANPAVRAGLRRVKGCAAMAAPRRVPPIAGTPHGTNRPASVAVAVAVGAVCRWHDHPAALGAHEVASEIVGELVARLGHRDVYTGPPTETAARLFCFGWSFAGNPFRATAVCGSF